ncbi:ubiquitin carboxyl-terminal hydrolase 16-like [Clavelina lepadiformis]|uniref:ubiquitin carboxyl-terminal hydrolase 16-like n=1 Tax=Clavelina lepadiformis TaxID=159417 RepID=UPI0040421117
MTKKKARQRQIISQANKSQRNNYKKDSAFSSNSSTTTECLNPDAVADKSIKQDVNLSDVDSPAPVGLSNLGNTCFFNSIMQNLIQTPLLHALLKHEIKLADSSRTVVVDCADDIPMLSYVPGSMGQITLALSSFFNTVITTQQTASSSNNTKRSTAKNKSVNPKSLFNHICFKNARFRGFQQQDSQELYHCLLDSIKMEEIKRKKQGILRSLNLEKAKAKEVSDDLRRKVKLYGTQVSEKEDTIIEKVFGGTLISSVLCDGCGTVTGVTESFHDLSLPILEEKRKESHHHNKVVNVEFAEEENAAGDGIIITKNPLSKHAQKKARKKAKKQNRQNFKKQTLCESPEKQESDTDKIEKEENNGEAIENLASSLAQSALSSAFSMLNLNFDNIEENGNLSTSDTCAKMKGGAVNGSYLNLPKEELADQNLNSLEAMLNGEDLKSDLENSVNSVISDCEKTTDKDSTDDVEMSKKAIPSLFDTPLRPQSLCTYSDFCKLPESLASRHHSTSQECSLQSCLYQFTMPEMLTGSNKFGCETCTKRQNGGELNEKTKLVYCSASKQMLISKPPLILTIHLKRFHQAGYNLRKVNKHVKIPTVLDIAPFCSTSCEKYASEDRHIFYSLYGMVEHSGSLTRGHYTAYVKVRPQNKRLINTAISSKVCDDFQSSNEDDIPGPEEWYHISDTIVSRSSEAKALNCNAYLLFYEQIM